MNATGTKTPAAPRKIARLLRNVFHEAVLQFALVVAVVVALFDGVSAISSGTIV